MDVPEVVGIAREEVLAAIEHRQASTYAIPDGDTVCESEVSYEREMTFILDAFRGRIWAPTSAPTLREAEHCSLQVLELLGLFLGLFTQGSALRLAMTPVAAPRLWDLNSPTWSHRHRCRP